MRWMQAKVGECVSDGEMTGPRYTRDGIEYCDMPTATFKRVGDQWERIE
jgi:hypothetical protein